MTIDIIIPNYKGIDLLRKNIPQLMEIIKDDRNIFVTIVDDGSGKDETEKLKLLVGEINRKLNIEIRLVIREINEGFSSNVNAGVFSSKADLVLLLNSDIVPEKGFLDNVTGKFTDDEKLFGIGLMDKSIENGKTILRGRGVGKWVKGFLVHSKGDINKSGTFWLSGGSSLLRRNIFIKIGGFDTLFNPFYWEDIDLSYRARKMGYRIIFENKNTVIHRHNEGPIRKYFNKFTIKKIAYRNQLIFIWKNITDINLICSHLVYLPYYFVKALLSFDLAFFYGFYLALVRLPAIIIKRQKQKGQFVKSDFDILKEFINE